MMNFIGSATWRHSAANNSAYWMANPGQPLDSTYPPPRRAWIMVVLLTLAYIVSYLDRYMLGLLVEPIKADMGLSDGQIGLLLGLAFAVFYATMGLPLGWMADRWRRTRIIAFAMILWSIATMACGLARNFWQLFIARMHLGVGEAALSPCAMSMIADSFPPERRGKPIAFYAMAMTVGSSIASMIGAFLLVWAKDVDIVLPIVGEIQPWQLAFLAIGAPGLVFAGVFFLLKEPLRQVQTMDDPLLTGTNLNDMFAYVGQRWRPYAGFMSLVCLMTICAYAHGWMAATFERTWGWAPEQYAAVNAVVLLIVGPTTIFLCGVFADRYSKRGHKDAPLLILIFGTLIHVPAGVIMMFMSSPIVAWVFLGLSLMGMSMVSAVNALILLNMTPARIRAQMVALYYMCMSLTGLILGPGTVGFLSQYVFGEEHLNYAMAVVPLLYGIIPILFIPATRRLYLEQISRLEAMEVTESATPEGSSGASQHA
jgi:MFS family permease